MSEPMKRCLSIVSDDGQCGLPDAHTGPHTLDVPDRMPWAMPRTDVFAQASAPVGEVDADDHARLVERSVRLIAEDASLRIRIADLEELVRKMRSIIGIYHARSHSARFEDCAAMLCSQMRDAIGGAK